MSCAAPEGCVYVLCRERAAPRSCDEEAERRSASQPRVHHAGGQRRIGARDVALVARALGDGA
eukprot:4619951-Pleurochrysis_carterae.AAC.1